MNVLSLFDGMSGGQIALKQLGIIPDKYYASEIDKHAMRQTMLNFPDTIQLGSVLDVDVSKLDKIDLLIGGSPCFAKGTSILTYDGYKNIEDIRIGDMVLTHKNRYKKVLNIGGKSSKTVLLKAQGIIPTITTTNHPYYVRDRNWIYNNNLRCSKRIFSDPKWVEVGSFDKKTSIGMSICDIEENNIGITQEEAFIIGRYIADGHTRKDLRVSENRPKDRHWQLILSIGNDKLEKFKSMISPSFRYSCYKHTQSTHRVVFSSKRLVEIVEYNCGCGAENKYISENLIRLPKDILKTLIDGYLSGDGSIMKNGGYSCTTISKMLSLTLPRAVSKVYGTHCNISFHTPLKQKELCGRIINQKPQYIIKFFMENRKQSNAKNIDGILWMNFKNITDNGIDVVYNIEVEEDNSYTANNAIVHNCQSFSFAGKRNGMNTTCKKEVYTLDRYLELKKDGFKFEGQSYLFWEYMRILEDIRKYNPDVLFLLENVEMGKKWERVLSDAIGIRGVHINSALVSAQNRKRIYWTNIKTRQDGFFGDLYSDISQPKDRSIFLRDILEEDVNEKYTVSQAVIDRLNKSHKSFTPKINPDKTGCLSIGNNSSKMSFDSGTTFVKIDKDGNIKSNQDKASCFTAGGNSGGNHSDMDLICVAMRGRNMDNPTSRKSGIPTEQTLEPRFPIKTNCLTSVQKDNLLYQLPRGHNKGDIFENKTPTLSSSSCEHNNLLCERIGGISINDRGIRPHRGNYKKTGISELGTIIYDNQKTDTCTTSHVQKIIIYDRIRRLTPTECARLQTVPDWYRWECSDTQIYKMCGNGWTIDVISHIFSFLPDSVKNK